MFVDVGLFLESKTDTSSAFIRKLRKNIRSFHENGTKVI